MHALLRSVLVSGSCSLGEFVVGVDIEVASLTLNETIIARHYPHKKTTYKQELLNVVLSSYGQGTKTAMGFIRQQKGAIGFIWEQKGQLPRDPVRGASDGPAKGATGTPSIQNIIVKKLVSVIKIKIRLQIKNYAIVHPFCFYTVK